ncbi:MAG TPA: CPBP family glutamic-type intramembrane protease [Mobilitalea sp.]|nr:CPBP family glutamic-type intramembrane protease [Mobilitalea sp.]
MDQFNSDGNVNLQNNTDNSNKDQQNDKQHYEQQSSLQQPIIQQSVMQQPVMQQADTRHDVKQNDVNQNELNQNYMNQNHMNQNQTAPYQVNRNNVPSGNPGSILQNNGYQNNMPQNSMYQNNVPQNNGYQNNVPQNNGYQNNVPQNNGYQNNISYGNMQYGNIPQAGNKLEIMQFNPQLNDFERLGVAPRKLISWAGFSLFMLAVVVFGIQLLTVKLVDYYKPELADTGWYMWALTFVSLVVIGLPVYTLIINKIPDSPKGEVVHMKPLRFIVIFLICSAAMYIANIFSSVLTFMIGVIKGQNVINPVAEAIYDSNYIITLIYAAVVAPIVEELIFRKMLLNKLRRFGDVPAILLSGLAFGIFHFNLSQFFYAVVLGFIFAYVTIRTNTILYSILLHMMINFISTAITPLVASGNFIASAALILWMFSAIILGTILLIVNLKKIRLEKTIPAMKSSYYILNWGTIFYVVLGLVIITIQTIA